MDDKESYQLELFSHSKNSAGVRKRSGSFFTSIRGYEKTILLIIGLVTTSLISFSFGVERGRRFSTVKSSVVPQVSLAVTENVPKPVAPPPPPVVIKEEPLKATAVLKMQGYTIQLASYKSMIEAQKEASALKVKGLSPLVLTKGNYIILCVGNFLSKENAKPLIAQLQGRYKGCYIRRL